MDMLTMTILICFWVLYGAIGPHMAMAITMHMVARIFFFVIEVTQVPLLGV